MKLRGLGRPRCAAPWRRRRSRVKLACEFYNRRVVNAGSSTPSPSPSPSKLATTTHSGETRHALTARVVVERLAIAWLDRTAHDADAAAGHRARCLGPERAISIGSLERSVLFGKEVGVESRGVPFWRLRLDYAPPRARTSTRNSGAIPLAGREPSCLRAGSGCSRSSRSSEILAEAIALANSSTTKLGLALRRVAWWVAQSVSQAVPTLPLTALLLRAARVRGVFLRGRRRR